MKAHGLLLARHAGGAECRHDGRVAVPERNTRWCSDGFKIACDNGERVRGAFALDCCDREAMSFVGTTGSISGDDVRVRMVAGAEENGRRRRADVRPRYAFTERRVAAAERRRLAEAGQPMLDAAQASEWWRPPVGRPASAWPRRRAG